MCKHILLGTALLVFAGLGACSDDDYPSSKDASLDAGPLDAGDGAILDGSHDSSADAGDATTFSDCLQATGSGASGTDTWTDGPNTASVTVSGAACERSFTLSTTQPLRDGEPANPRTFSEVAGWPSISTNNQMLDALYALALEEVRENSVAAITDGAYNGGQPIPCPVGGCFETGRLWTFVWTRDTAYAADLGLAALDPTRVRNSLELKLSELRGGGGRQIIQDTGSGGSYPVSTDRAAWALGAWRLLGFLEGSERAGFVTLAWEAVRNTILQDRAVVFDQEMGLYLGEQSFLDWREQSYPPWTATDTVQIHMSQSLSTNLDHLRLLELGAWLAGETGDLASQTQLQGWADDLRSAMDAAFYLPAFGLYSTFTPTTLDRAPVRRFDLLSTSLAVLSDLGTPSRRADLVRAYPHLPLGAPVLWPQQKEVPIYHNRALWPFVTAYWLRAARQVRNDAAVNHNLRSLMRGAAMNLSNMESFECVSGAPYLADGAYSGPVVNSQRQLWSVAGFISAIHDVIFGLETTPDGIRFLPYVTRELRAGLLAGADSLVLNDLPYRGKRITVVVRLPAVTGDSQGAYSVGEILLNGASVPPDILTPGQLLDQNLLEITLEDSPELGDSISLQTDTGEYRNLFGPLPPTITQIAATPSGLELSFVGGGEPVAEVAFNVYRDGALLASDLPGSTATWTDETASATSPSHCYTVESYFVLSGNHSQHARAFCWWGPGADRITTFDALSFAATGGSLVFGHGAWHYESWGEPSHTITLSNVWPSHTGDHYVQLTYGNGSGPVSTGITCATKRVEVTDELTDQVVGSGVVVMPQLGSWDSWMGSSFLKVPLDSSHSYRISIFADDTTINMSDFEHNALYGGNGGSGGAYHYVNISEIKLLSLTGNP